MARYIDADSLYRRVKTHTNPYGKPTLDYKSGVKVLEMINQEPTADVVPKSEVAREIFEEIDEILHCHGITIGLVFDEANGANMAIGRIDKMIAELKKKYTEDKP